MTDNTIGLFLYRNAGTVKQTGVISRGTWTEIHGGSVFYIGPTPDNRAYFWINENDVRSLSNEELKGIGFELKPGTPF